MRNNADYMKSKSDDWATPKLLYNFLISNGFLDPCPLHCKHDNLNRDYHYEKLFINPPFSNISKWVDYAIRQYDNGCDIVFLMPARTDTIYFHKLISVPSNIYFIKGRLHFNDSKDVAPFPCIIVELFHSSLSQCFFHCTLEEYCE